MRDERALIAEAQRFVFGRGDHLLDLARRFGGAKADEQVDRFRNRVLWSREAPEWLPFAEMIDILRVVIRRAPEAQDSAADLLVDLLRLARDAETLRARRGNAAARSGGCTERDC
jgi:hypothetical protein